MIHTGQLCFVGESCKRKFTRASSLFKDQMMHIGERTCVCEICNKGYSQAMSLHPYKNN